MKKTYKKVIVSLCICVLAGVGSFAFLNANSILKTIKKDAFLNGANNEANINSPANNIHLNNNSASTASIQNDRANSADISNSAEQSQSALNAASKHSSQPENSSQNKVVAASSQLEHKNSREQRHIGNRSLPSSFRRLQDKYNLTFIPTYDHYNQLTHPKVLYFPQGWNGYKYWMSMTPYPYGCDDNENPSIVVSNDNVNWEVPAGLKNPITGIPADVKIGGHYSDSHLVMHNNVMELWFRYNPGNPQNRRTKSQCTYYRMSSSNGIYWTKPEKLFDANDGCFSLAILYEDGIYKAWYTNSGYQIRYMTSADGFNWSSTELASFDLPDGYTPWHQDVIKLGSEYFMLLTAKNKSKTPFALFCAKSSNGINFTNVKRILPNGGAKKWDGVSFYRSTFFENENKHITMYISTILPGRKWFLTKQDFNLQDITSHSGNDFNYE